jgi:death-on-curing protein
LRDRGALELAVAQPSLVLFEVEKHVGLVSKAVALGYALISLHPFIDGNKRVGHAAMEIMLFINGYEIVAEVAEQERVVLAVAASQMSREALEVWLEQHIQPR